MVTHATRVRRYKHLIGGECCVFGTRLLIEGSVADEWVEKLVEKSRFLRVGDPMGESTDIGALIHREHAQKVLGYIRRGEEEGRTS